jgi:chromosome segregation ATPase
MVTTVTTENTVTGWAGVIADLSAKRQAAQAHAQELRNQKAALALEAAMGSDAAKKQVTKLNQELAHLTLEADDWDSAIRQAESEKQKAEQAEKDAAERERQAELSRLASTAINHAAEFTASLQQAVKAGAAVKAVIQKMLPLARPDEMTNLNRILERGPFMRCAQWAGLQPFIEFQDYPGPKDHITALQTELSIYLGKWLNNQNGKE